MADANSAVLDHHARQLGFPDYQTWAAWNAHRTQAITGGSHTTAGPDGQPQNWLQHALASIPIHPAYLMNYVSDRYHQATGF